MKIAMILILSGAILLVVGFVVKAFSFRKWMRTGRTVTYEGFLAHVMPRLTKRLALSTEQQEKVKALAQRTIAKVRTLRLDLAERRAKLARLVEQAAPDDAAIRAEVDAIKQIAIDLGTLARSAADELQTILTPLQQAKLALMRGKRRGHGHRRSRDPLTEPH